MTEIDNSKDCDSKEESNNTEAVSKVVEIESNLSKRQKLLLKKKQKAMEKIKPEHLIPRGTAKSGRIWKTQKEKFRKIHKSLPKYSKEKQLKLRDELRHIKEISRSIKDDKKQENQLKKQRREENAKRRLENERKSEIVQVIKNPAKIKRMRKKQLRSIEKRDLSKVKVV